MAIKRYDGNRKPGDGTTVLRVRDINNIIRDVPLGGTVDLSPAVFAIVDQWYILTDSALPPPPPPSTSVTAGIYIQEVLPSSPALGALWIPTLSDGTPKPIRFWKVYV